jgi:hypothetical protein
VYSVEDAETEQDQGKSILKGKRKRSDSSSDKLPPKKPKKQRETVTTIAFSRSVLGRKEINSKEPTRKAPTLSSTQRKLKSLQKKHGLTQRLGGSLRSYLDENTLQKIRKLVYTINLVTRLVQQTLLEVVNHAFDKGLLILDELIHGKKYL